MNPTQQLTLDKSIPHLKKSPMYYKDLGTRLLKEGLKPRGVDPLYSIYSDLFFNSKGPNPQVKMLGKGVFSLIDWKDEDPTPYVPSRKSTPKEMTKEEILSEIKRLQNLLKESSTK